MRRLFIVPALILPADCTLNLPGSKSHANRAIVCAALAEGETTITGVTQCDDVAVMVENLQKLGFSITWKNNHKDQLVVQGGVPRHSQKAVLDCHNAGTTIRFLASVAALVPGEWTLTGDEHMKKRPIGDLTSALRMLGADIKDIEGKPPMQIRGGQLHGRSVSIKSDQSSQFLSSLLLIAPCLREGLTVELFGELASSGYADLTESVMKDFGVTIVKKLNTFIVQRTTYCSKNVYKIETDWSAAGAWLALNELTGSRIVLPDLRSVSLQSDRALPEAMIKLRSMKDVTLDCSNIPDQVMNICILAALRKAKTVLTGIANLRKKECDRLAVIASELRKTGIDIIERGDDLVIRGIGSLARMRAAANDVILDPHDDHRMAMAFALLGLLRGKISIHNPECVKKSYPSFFSDLEKVTRNTRAITVVGMRGVGKSSLGKRLAVKLRMKHLDSDHLFEESHGTIKEYIKNKGWEAFRRQEEEIIVAAIKPCTVLSLGGGALGSEKTRRLIRDKTIAVWLQAKESELIKRLQNGKRPPLTDLPIHEEVRKFLLERGPHYREVAKITISPSVRFREQIPFVVRYLPESIGPKKFLRKY